MTFKLCLKNQHQPVQLPARETKKMIKSEKSIIEVGDCYLDDGAMTMMNSLALFLRCELTGPYFTFRVS